MYLLTSEDCCAVGGAEFAKITDAVLMGCGIMLVITASTGCVVAVSYALDMLEMAALIAPVLLFGGVGLAFFVTPANE